MTEHPYQAFLREALPASAAQRGWTGADGALPALYLGHGAPPLLESRRWMGELFGWARTLPKPRNVLIVSAHWEAAPIAVSQPAAGTPLIYDFAGFDPLYYQMRYATPDATQLANCVVASLSHTAPGQAASSASARVSGGVYRHPRRGLDHGAWVPLMSMYPAADVPVLQLSLPTHEPDRLLEIGQRLRQLREEGTLIIGSGFMTHGLPFLTHEQFTGREPEPAWSRDFDAWAGEALAAGNIEELCAFASKAPGMPYAHPTVEHFVPVFVTLGAASRPDQAVQTTIEGYFFGLSKRSFQVT
ncbi:MAG: class III extradiol ring-cleavage dioxygenase [Candidatus Accumulibacter sp.]|uniref:dioxygenase family protein n=1 Tax=Accumulibacter sp. TaxID=2053492 RepID=UPI002878F532|nr:class III extradiol ring-cleavage dioxygenase [Accumulibacter sp.]MDS4014993.1 class III extradiol ring-cleavage dioxygenase [Accumulibacter sp.]